MINAKLACQVDTYYSVLITTRLVAESQWRKFELFIYSEKNL